MRSQVHQGDLAIMEPRGRTRSRVRAELERLRDRLGQLGTEQLELEEWIGAIGADEGAQRDRRVSAEARIGELERAQLDTLRR